MERDKENYRIKQKDSTGRDGMEKIIRAYQYEISGFGIFSQPYGKKFAEWCRSKLHVLCVPDVLGENADNFVSFLESHLQGNSTMIGSDIHNSFGISPIYVISEALNAENGCSGFAGCHSDHSQPESLLYNEAYPRKMKKGDLTMNPERLDRIFSDLQKALGWKQEKASFITMHFL